MKLTLPPVGACSVPMYFQRACRSSALAVKPAFMSSHLFCISSHLAVGNDFISFDSILSISMSISKATVKYRHAIGQGIHKSTRKKRQLAPRHEPGHGPPLQSGVAERRHRIQPQHAAAGLNGDCTDAGSCGHFAAWRISCTASRWLCTAGTRRGNTRTHAWARTCMCTAAPTVSTAGRGGMRAGHGCSTPGRCPDTSRETTAWVYSNK